MGMNEVRFSIAKHAAWAPGVTTAQAWADWARAPFVIGEGAEPAVRLMPPMLRRRAGFLGKMALEVAFQCLDGRTGVPTVFCSRHGEAARAVELLGDLAQGSPLSPTGFGLAVHNASAGLFSIARSDQANHVALAAGASTIEHAVIEACGLLADGAALVLLVAYDCRLPPVFAHFQDCDEQPHAWAWLMAPAAHDAISLSWTTSAGCEAAAPDAMPPPGTPAAGMPASLDILLFQLSGQPQLERVTGGRRWRWARHA